MERRSSEYLPENFSSLIRQLGPAVLNHRIRSEDIKSVADVRFITGQEKLLSGLIYLGTQTQFAAMHEVYVYDGAAIIVCNADRAQFTSDRLYAGATVLETSASPAVVFNLLNDLLANAACTVPKDTQGDLRRIWGQVMDGKLLVSQDIIEVLSHAGVTPKRHFRLMVAAFSGSQPAPRRFAALRDELNGILQACQVLIYEETVVAMLFYDDRTLSTAPPSDELEPVLEKYGACAMMSHCSSDYTMMRTMYLLCQRSLDIAMKLEPSPRSRFFHINDYAMYYAIDMCAQRCAQMFGHMNILLLIHPSIVAIRRYDLAHNSDLMEVMNCYIRNSGSISKTAEDMFVHRNTVNNKISRIKSMLPFDLDDGAVRQLLLFSYQTLKFYEEILKLEVRKE